MQNNPTNPSAVGGQPHHYNMMQNNNNGNWNTWGIQQQQAHPQQIVNNTWNVGDWGNHHHQQLQQHSYIQNNYNWNAGRYYPHQQHPQQNPQQHPHNGKNLRKTRTNFTAEHIAVLENIFTNQQYPSKEERNAVASHLGLTDAQVNTWFQNRRAKLKKQGGMVGAVVTQISASAPGPSTGTVTPAASSASSSPETDQSTHADVYDETVKYFQEAAVKYEGLLQQLDSFENQGQGQYTSVLTDQAPAVKTDVYDGQGQPLAQNSPDSTTPQQTRSSKTPESQEDVPSPENNPEGQQDEGLGEALVMYGSLLQQFESFENQGQGPAQNSPDSTTPQQNWSSNTPESQEDVQKDVPSPENNPEGQKDEGPGKDMPLWDSFF